MIKQCLTSVFRLGIWVLIISSAAVCLQAQSRTVHPALPPNPQQYRHDVWDQAAGLPTSSINAIVQSRDGYLWMGTAEGLYRFDGARFTRFDRRNVPEL